MGSNRTDFIREIEMKNLIILLFLILSFTVSNAAYAYCEYTRNGAGNGEIRLKFVEMKNSYHALYPECETLPQGTCFQFDYDADGCLRTVYFIPVSKAQTPTAFNITELYGQFDHLNFWAFDYQSASQGFLLVVTFTVIGYSFGSLKTLFMLGAR